MQLSINQILKATGGRLARPQALGPRPIPITGISTDSRTLQPGDLFVPLRGPRADGHTFIADAFRRGAAAALCAPVEDAARRLPFGPLPDDAVLITVDDPLRALGRVAGAYRDALRVTVVGVTGSVGKTTTAKMCAAVLGRRFRVTVSREEWNAEVGVPLTLLGLREEHEVAVVEMAMRGLGQIAELVEIAQPLIGIVTNIGEAHLELLGSLDHIASAKGELIAGLPANGVAVLNGDDELVAGLARLCRGRVLTYGLRPGADITASEIHSDRTGMEFQMASSGGRVGVRLQAWGRHNVSNALAAAAVGVAMDMDLVSIGEGLAAYRPAKMRLEPVRLGDILLINDAYNASPASMRAALDVLEDVGEGRRLVAVLGEMKELGAESPALHREIGRDLGRRRVASLVAVGEGAVPIAEGAAEAGMDRAAITRAHSNHDAVEVLRAGLRPEDVVLVKGSRAVQMEEIVDALKRDFSAQSRSKL